MKSLLVLILAVIINVQCHSQLSTTQTPEPSPNSVKLNLWATYYYVPILQHDENGIDLLDANEKNTGLKLSSCDWCTACIEGTVFIKKANEVLVLNYAGRSETIKYDCRACPKYKNYDGYVKTGKVLWGNSSGFGQGVDNYNLIPFKSIAVDKSQIPIGSALFIPDAVGIFYTDVDGIQKSHNGYFFAADVGSKIIGNHIDVFIGTETLNPFSFVQSNESKTFDAYIVSNELKKTELEALHR